MTEDPNMWDYWREKYASPRHAIECQFPETLASDPVLQVAVAQIKAGEMALEARMEQLDQETREL